MARLIFGRKGVWRQKNGALGDVLVEGSGHDRATCAILAPFWTGFGANGQTVFAPVKAGLGADGFKIRINPPTCH